MIRKKPFFMVNWKVVLMPKWSFYEIEWSLEKNKELLFLYFDWNVMASTTCSLKWLDELQHEILVSWSPISLCKTLWPLLCLVIWMFSRSRCYSGVHIRMDKPRFMKQMAYFWPSLVGNKSAITPQPFRLHFGIACSFKMRYFMNFYLNWHKNYVRMKLKACFLLSEFGSSKFELS